MALRAFKEDGGWLVVDVDDENSEILGRGSDRAAAIAAGQDAIVKRDAADEKQRIDAGTTCKGKGAAAIERYRDGFEKFCGACAEHIKDGYAQEFEEYRQSVLGILDTPGLASALGLFDKDEADKAIKTIVHTLNTTPENPHAYFAERRQEVEKYVTSISHIQSAINIASTRSQPPGTILQGKPPESVYHHLIVARDTLQWELQNFMMGGTSARGDLLGSTKGGHDTAGYHRRLMARSVFDNLPKELATPYKLTSELMAAVGVEMPPDEVRKAAAKNR